MGVVRCLTDSAPTTTSARIAADPRLVGCPAGKPSLSPYALGPAGLGGDPSSPALRPSSAVWAPRLAPAARDAVEPPVTAFIAAGSSRQSLVSPAVRLCASAPSRRPNGSVRSALRGHARRDLAVGKAGAVSERKKNVKPLFALSQKNVVTATFGLIFDRGPVMNMNKI